MSLFVAITIVILPLLIYFSSPLLIHQFFSFVISILLPDQVLYVFNFGSVPIISYPNPGCHILPFTATPFSQITWILFDLVMEMKSILEAVR